MKKYISLTNQIVDVIRYLDYRNIVLEKHEFDKVTNLIFSDWSVEDAVNYVIGEMI